MGGELGDVEPWKCCGKEENLATCKGEDVVSWNDLVVDNYIQIAIATGLLRCTWINQACTPDSRSTVEMR